MFTCCHVFPCVRYGNTIGEMGQQDVGWFWLMGKQEKMRWVQAAEGRKQEPGGQKRCRWADKARKGLYGPTICLIYVPSPCLSHLKFFLLLPQKSKTEMETESDSKLKQVTIHLCTFLEMIYLCLLEVEAVDYGIFWTWNEIDEIFQSRKSPKKKHFLALWRLRSATSYLHVNVHVIYNAVMILLLNLLQLHASFLINRLSLFF